MKLLQAENLSSWQVPFLQNDYPGSSQVEHALYAEQRACVEINSN